jgi:Protein of unknown function (DUF1580)
MIDPLTEKLLAFSEASKCFPPRRRGRRPSISCFYRWTTSGCRGVLLEYVQCGGQRMTSREAIGRFLERLTNASAPRRTATLPQPNGPTAPRNARAIAAAAAYLDKEGV